MLDDWEGRQWAALEERLSADPELTRKAAAIARLSRRRRAFQRRFYPAGYLASALGYMMLAMGGAVAVELFWFVALATVGGAFLGWLALH